MVGRYDHVRQRHLLDTWLQRSGDCPLSIQLGYSEELLANDAEEEEEGFDSGNRVILRFIESLRCHASRWQEMDISLPFDVLRSIAEPMPLLCTVAIG
ncbi:hypothetical protein FB45DRAFT_914570 [Roridomyces roridus]|uniref:Uncharacterized protein n=1 Tax=Roridomyces roridus TaxID=1738132 RepID=A0AAD7BXX6_9AGAR|nr:hypothetical protein FB45DRAFT_914570 [Roridomyces roridus]